MYKDAAHHYHGRLSTGSDGGFIMDGKKSRAEHRHNNLMDITEDEDNDEEEQNHQQQLLQRVRVRERKESCGNGNETAPEKIISMKKTAESENFD